MAYIDHGPSSNLVSDSRESIWKIAEELFPRYRALCGPDFRASLEHLQNYLALEIKGFKTGSTVGDWSIPPEFVVNEAWVEGPDGKRVLDFRDHPYHVHIYGGAFDGEMSLDELLKHVSTHPDLPDAIPLRQSYYRYGWGLCASQNQVKTWKSGTYKVHIDTELNEGELNVGEYYLPGETDQEIMVCTYLCHPYGANDNLSGVSVATELFRRLTEMKDRHYSYRLCIWPETIGALTWIDANRDNLDKIVGGYEIAICGDDAPIRYVKSYYGDAMVDRAYAHALRNSGLPHEILEYDGVCNGSDQAHFNAIGLRIPFGHPIRGGHITPDIPGKKQIGYPEYHSSADDLTIIKPENLSQILEITWDAFQAIERARTYRATFTGTPFLSKHGVYPYQHGLGTGTTATKSTFGGLAYYQLMVDADGEKDLLAIADDSALPIEAYDDAVASFLSAGLIEEIAE